ncbi:hypothetical protein [Virgibacillus sediminis]|uniref:PepSY domain-containing protein n=1 Tax=Virgibacillus sediminis TaxID=202260 RepID=A0ABV7A7Z2_9BACI
MNEHLQKLTDRIADQFGLQQYHLKNHSIFRQSNVFNETIYILNMEWFPNNSPHSEDGFNPPGTAVIDADIHSGRIRRIIFSEDTTYAESGFFPDPQKETAIEWMEEMTGLEFGRQFRLVDEGEDNLLFQAAVDNVPVYPSGTIEIQFNAQGELTLFSIDGTFPQEDQIRWEPFNLTLEKTEPVSRQQIKLLEIPVEAEKRWLPVYGPTTAFLTNDGKRSFSFEEVEKRVSFVEKDELLMWKEPADDIFAEEEVDFSLEVNEEQALARKPDPDAHPLTEGEQDKAVQEAVRFLQRVFPDDSGNWRLTSIYRQNGYVFVELQPSKPSNRVVERKIRLVLDKEDLHAVSYLDNQVIVDIFSQFDPAGPVKLSTEEAFETLKNHIKVTPVYVYDADHSSYILCGKIDSEYGVDAQTGELVALNEL